MPARWLDDRDAIPTEYAGVWFRSRLEARWAAFFDLAKWRWSYEPIDFEGWAPDFLLTIPNSEPAWVEVIAETESELVEAASSQVERFVGDGRVILLGLGPIEGSLGLFAMLPRPKWRRLHEAELGVDARDLWNRAGNPLERKPRAVDCTPVETMIDDCQVDWRRRAVNLSRARWASPLLARDWGLIIGSIGRSDPVLAGTLVGVDKADMDDEILEVWLPRYSIRGAILEGMGSTPSAKISELFDLKLVTHLMGDA